MSPRVVNLIWGFHRLLRDSWKHDANATDINPKGRFSNIRPHPASGLPTHLKHGETLQHSKQAMHDQVARSNEFSQLASNAAEAFS